MCFEKLLLKFCSNYKVVKLLDMFISCFIVIVFVISYWTTAQGVLILFIKNDIQYIVAVNVLTGENTQESVSILNLILATLWVN